MLIFEHFLSLPCGVEVKFYAKSVKVLRIIRFRKIFSILNFPFLSFTMFIRNHQNIFGLFHVYWSQSQFTILKKLLNNILYFDSTIFCTSIIIILFLFPIIELMNLYLETCLYTINADNYSTSIHHTPTS